MAFWTNGGGLIVGASGNPIDCADCPCEAVPCTCPCTSDTWAADCGYSACYAIDGYSNTMFTACGDCDPDTGTQWDGQFDSVDNSSFTCTWSTGGSGATQINSKKFDFASITLDTGACEWVISIGCIDTGLGRLAIWEGRKTVGATPAGVYSWTNGCDTTTSISVVACP